MSPPADTATTGSRLDGCARPHLAAGERLPAYRTLGTIGAAVSALVVTSLAVVAGRPWPELLLVVGTAPLAFLLAVKLSVIAFGHERIVFYEKTLFVLGATAGALSAGGRPIGAGMDLAAIGIGVFLIFGRLGCFMVACCYGRPARWGVRYGEAHARVGFPRWLVGTPLFPVQLVDAAVSLIATSAAVVAWLWPVARGEAAVIFLALYGPGRFAEELVRFDAARPRWARASEAQWTAFVIGWVLVAIEPRWWTIASAALITIGLAAVLLRRRRFADAWHTAELAAALPRLDDGAPRVVTSLGVHASLARLETPQGPLRDYVLSAPDAHHPLGERDVQRLVAALGLVGAAVHPATTPGLFHVLVASTQARNLKPPR